MLVMNSFLRVMIWLELEMNELPGMRPTRMLLTETTIVTRTKTKGITINNNARQRICAMES